MNRTLIALNELTKERFVQYGLRLGDRILIKPAWGHKKIYNLKHTEIYFSARKSHELNKKEFILPDPSDEDFKVILKLSSTYDKDFQNQERFYLKSLNSKPFWINGQWCFECFVERGDKIQIGQNYIELIHEPIIKNIKDHSIENIRLDDNIIKSKLNILLEGETGTGKTFLAKKIHEKSESTGKFVHLNLSAYTPELLESELFGHKKGAFTGAVYNKIGALEEANNGTLFLDEIDSLSLNIQTKLLLFLDSGKFRGVGSNKETKINTRFIFASGRDLNNLILKADFRKDFFYRIASGAHYKLKPLREKEFLIKKYCEIYSITHKTSIPQNLIEFYQTLPWPGNIRQLKGHLDKKKMTTKTGKLYFDSFDDSLLAQSSDLNFLNKNFKSMLEMKKAYAKKIFIQSEQNLTLSSKRLGMSKRTLKKVLDLVS